MALLRRVYMTIGSPDADCTKACCDTAPPLTRPPQPTRAHSHMGVRGRLVAWSPEAAARAALAASRACTG